MKNRRNINARISRRGVRLAGAGMVAHPPDAATILQDAMSEREFQANVRKSLENRGWIIWAFPEMRLTNAGVPDLIFWHPNVPHLLCFWELKTNVGRLSRKQRAALNHLATVDGADVRVVRPSTWGQLRDAIDNDSGDIVAALRAIDREV